MTYNWLLPHTLTYYNLLLIPHTSQMHTYTWASCTGGYLQAFVKALLEFLL